jgi:hypothetical protein
MRALAVVVADPIRNLRAGVIEAEEQGFVENLVRIRPLKLSQKPFCVGFPGAMKCQAIWLSSDQVSMALQVNSVPLSETIMPGLPRRSISAVSSRATRRPGIEVSGIAARHSRGHVIDDIQFRIRKRRPLANWPWTKSNDQRAFGRASTRIGARVPTARPALTHAEAFLPVDQWFRFSPDGSPR